MRHYIVQGSLSPAMPFAFTVAGLPYDLTGKSVQVSAQRLEETFLTIDHAGCAIASNPATGSGDYIFQAGDTDVGGQYRVRWTIPEDDIDLPVKGYDYLIISPALPVT